MNTAPAETIQTPDDAELMQGLLQHEPDALEKLHARYRTILKSVILQVIHDDADAEDVLQDVFMQLWDRAGTYSPEKGKLLGWLVTLARRRAIDRLRQRYAYRRATDRYETFCRLPEGELASDRTVERETQREDLRQLFNRLMSNLPIPQRQVIELTFFENMSQREISTATATPLGTVKTRIELGLKKLSHALAGSRDKVM